MIGLHDVQANRMHPRSVRDLRGKVDTTAGEGIKGGAEGTKNVTDKVVDSVEKKVNEVTTVVSDALGSAADAIHRAASDDSKPKKSKHK